MKQSSAFLLGLCATVGLSVPVLADGINARVKKVDPGANTITVVERQEDHVFTVCETTKFTNAQGDVLVTGLKLGNTTTLEAGLKSGFLKAGTRLAITYQKQGDKFLASQVQLRDKQRETHPK